MKINDLIKFEGNYFLALSNPFILKGQREEFNLHVIKVLEFSNETIDLLEIKKDKIKKINWYFISRNQILSESFIREFQDKIRWDVISYRQTLSESFIREFQDKIYWWGISQYQTLSESFIRKFQNKVNWYCIFKNKNIPDEIKEKFKNKKPAS